MADETDAGMKAPATGLATEIGRRIDGVFGSCLSCPAFFFGGNGSFSFRVEGALVNHASPGFLSDAAFSPVVMSMLKSLR